MIIDGDIGEPIPEYLQDRRSGWYVARPGNNEHYAVVEINIQQGDEAIPWALMDSWCTDFRYDQYLLLDGRMFTFIDKDIRPDPEFNFKIEDIPGGWQITHEMRFKYMGRDFYAGHFNTVLLNQ